MELQAGPEPHQQGRWDLPQTKQLGEVSFPEGTGAAGRRGSAGTKAELPLEIG